MAGYVECSSTTASDCPGFPTREDGLKFLKKWNLQVCK